MLSDRWSRPVCAIEGAQACVAPADTNPFPNLPPCSSFIMPPVSPCAMLVATPADTTVIPTARIGRQNLPMKLPIALKKKPLGSGLAQRVIEHIDIPVQTSHMKPV